MSDIHKHNKPVSRPHVRTLGPTTSYGTVTIRDINDVSLSNNPSSTTHVPGSSPSNEKSTPHRTITQTSFHSLSSLLFLPFFNFFYYCFLLSFTFLHHGNWLHFRTVLAHHKNRKILMLYMRIRHITTHPHLLFSFHSSSFFCLPLA